MSVSFRFADGGLGEGYFYDGGAREAAGDGFVEIVHVRGQEALTDQPESLNLLCVVVDNRSAAEGYSGVIVHCEIVFLGFITRSAPADGAQTNERIGFDAVDFFAF